MEIKGITDEDFINYRMPSMYISTATCTFKCDKECGLNCCQNSSLAQAPSIDISIEQLVRRYLQNPITKAIVFGGLEPLDQADDVIEFISCLRQKYVCNDTVVIYTGYKQGEDQTISAIRKLKQYPNIIVKYGRYIPNRPGRYDELLGVNLASDNQYAVRLI